MPDRPGKRAVHPGTDFIHNIASSIHFISHQFADPALFFRVIGTNPTVMKKIILTALLGIITMAENFAQEKIAPRTEFTLGLSTAVLELKQGGTGDITVNLNRSKGYSRSNAVLTLSSGLPEGVSVTFEPATGVMEKSIATVSVAEHTKPGNYMIIVNGTIQHKNKGATLKLIVGERTAAGVVTSIH